MKDKTYDVVVVGAGVMGAVVARTLSEAGKSVLVLEAGTGDSLNPEKYRSYVDDFYTDTIKATSTGYPENEDAPWPDVLQIGNPPSSSYFVQRPRSPMLDGTYDGPVPFLSDYIRMAGGTTLHWQGSSFRMLPNDFHIKMAYDRGHDWPVTYDDLMPFYRDAEREIGVSADVGDQSYLGVWFENWYRYPMKRMPQSYLDKFFARKLRNMKVKIGKKRYAVDTIPLPQGRNSTPHPDYVNPDGTKGYQPVSAIGDHDSGLRCQGNSTCMPICPVQAKYSALKTLHAAQRGGVKIQTKSVASKLVIDSASGRVKGVQYKQYKHPSDPKYETRVARGRIVVLAANAVENVTLMLASGAQDSSGQLGRNLMDHPYIYVYGNAPEPVYPFRGPDTTTGLDSLRDGRFRADHAAFRVSLSNWGWSGSPGADVASRLAQHMYGAELRESLREQLTTQVKLGIMCEQLPSADNRVTIDPRYRDTLGNYRPVLDYRIDDYSMGGVETAVRIVGEVLDRCGITDATEFFPNRIGYQYLTHNGKGYNIMGSGHIVGTHRMGKDRRDGVVDKNLRHWDHKNLYLIGCGSMVTIGTCNPTLTGAALSFKAAAAILRALK